MKALWESVHQADVRTSICRVGGQIGISHMSIQRIMSKKLHLFRYKTRVLPQHFQFGFRMGEQNRLYQ